jgi:16S rRNA (cytosine967-C5)-methyltransferase
MQLAAAGHRVTSLDSSESRLARLRENLARTHLDSTLVRADALKWKAPQQFDAVLLDAPCSATGTFRRHPEVLYRARLPVIADNAALQARLLVTATQWLKPGGALVYSVCSLEQQEGEQVIDAFLRDHPEFRADAAHDVPEFMPKSATDTIRILPGLLEAEGGLDGFFMARLVRGA